MKNLTTLLAMISVAGLAAWEVSWQLKYPLADDTVVSSTFGHVAQERSLPEGSVLPYGQGVFVRRVGLPLWATSKLVFTGYCKRNIHLAWPTERELTVGCVVLEGSVMKFPAPDGITITNGSGS